MVFGESMRKGRAKGAKTRLKSALIKPQPVTKSKRTATKTGGAVRTHGSRFARRR